MASDITSTTEENVAYFQAVALKSCRVAWADSRDGLVGNPTIVDVGWVDDRDAIFDIVCRVQLASERPCLDQSSWGARKLA